MSKYLLVTLVLLIAVTVWRHKHRKTIQQKQHRPSRKGSPPQAMVRCAHCGVHLPQADASDANGHFFCSPAHRQRGPRQP